MNEIQEVAQAIYDKHKALWPLTWVVADFMAKQMAGDQGETVISHLTHELMEFNEAGREAAVEKVSLLDRLDQAYQNLDRLHVDLASELEAINDAEALIRAIHQALDRKEWDSDTASDIASLLTEQGMEITGPRDDCELTADELQQRYAEAYRRWGEHPRFSRNGWLHEVANGDTQRGYWDWVVSQIEQEGND